MAAPPPSTITFAIRGPIARGDLPALYSRVCLMLTQSRATVAICDVMGVAADAVSVDALARLGLAARRHRCRIELRHASEELRDLIAFMGLDDILVSQASGREG
ncbi:MAG: STAS domain-containing protein [Solirubrobacterales bacterium]|nr:STAS domain-containing protein [Solirubrobacterales bacterium]MBV9943208.1 STAS domain-containing protein [Solirubrobacterales bacterium]